MEIIEGGLGHHYFPEELDFIDEIKTHPNKLNFHEVQARSKQKLPIFSDFQSFLDSDFFQKNNNLGTLNLQHYKSNSGESIFRLHRMLLILGYMNNSDYFISHLELQGSDSDAYREEPNGGIHREDFFSTKTGAAVKAFQKNNRIPDDGVVGNITKMALYKELYNSYHISQNSHGERIHYVFLQE